MANAACINEKGEFRLCPFRVIAEVHPALVRGSGDVTTQHFYPCVGLECAAFYDGICLRLQEAVRATERNRGNEETADKDRAENSI